ncbi:unnamed protein product [Amoebophrya sp. A120]|nr:unnamed protein product [Amoebophrya sp. A120]|eukprot:GSA120T00019417001.1
MAAPSMAFPLLFFHFNRNKVWHRDKRLTREELQQFPEIWTTWERRCYRQFLDEAKDWNASKKDQQPKVHIHYNKNKGSSSSSSTSNIGRDSESTELGEMELKQQQLQKIFPQEHIYHTLQEDVKKCRKRMHSNATLESAHECHYRIKELTDVCLYAGVHFADSAAPVFDDTEFHRIAATAFQRLEEGRGRHEIMGVRGK